MTRRIGAALLLLATWSSAAAEARGEDRYYAIIFGSQVRPFRPRYAHTWATFVRVSGESADPNELEAYQHTISWMAETFVVRADRLGSQPGVALDLYRTIEVVKEVGENVTAWGPFEITPEVYQASLDVKSHIDSGGMLYRGVDIRADLVVNDCVHAVAAIHPAFGRGHLPLIKYGRPASRCIARSLALRGGIDQSRVDASWLIPRLGLDALGVEVVSPSKLPGRPCVFCRFPE